MNDPDVSIRPFELSDKLALIIQQDTYKKMVVKNYKTSPFQL